MYIQGDCPLQLTQDDVCQGINRLASNKAIDSGGMYVKMIKWGGLMVWATVHHQLNKALENGLEHEWFISKAVMLYKKGDKKDLIDYD